MEMECIVVQVQPAVTGTSARGEWTKQEVIFEQPGDFGKKVCVSFWGDKAQDAAGLVPGEKVKVAANVESREYNGRWYTEVRAWKLDRAGGGASAGGAMGGGSQAGGSYGAGSSAGGSAPWGNQPASGGYAAGGGTASPRHSEASTSPSVIPNAAGGGISSPAGGAASGLQAGAEYDWETPARPASPPAPVQDEFDDLPF